jgi:hypothetical protein
MRRFSTIVALALATLLSISICSAQQTATTTVPNLIRYSGTLKDAQVATFSSSTAVGVTFSIYKQQDGGASVWMETQNVTPDSNGQYNVILGSTTAAGLPGDLFSQQEQRWLGVQVQGQAEEPRVLLVSVPYAFKAHEAETLGGLPASAFVKAPTADASVGRANAAGTAVNALAGAGSAGGASKGKGTNGRLAPAICTPVPGRLIFWDSQGSECPSSLFQVIGGSTNGFIGIGLTNPSEPLDVFGQISTYKWYDINEQRIVSVHRGPGQAPTGSTNLFLGWDTGTNNVGNTNNNTFVGRAAGNQNITGQGNTFTGEEAGYWKTTGDQNTFSGYRAGYRNYNGTSNAIYGYDAGHYNNGSYNVFVGAGVDFGSLPVTTGSNNTFAGYEAGVANTTGHNNVFYGFQAGRINTVGHSNVYLANLGGLATDSNTIRIGGTNGTATSQQNRVFVEPILSNNNTLLTVVTIDPTPGLPTHGKLGWRTITTGGNVSGSCPPDPNGFFITQWLSLNTIGCSPIFHKTSNDFIGIATTNPSTELDVNGDINAKYDRTSYQINEHTVLQVFGVNNLAVGVGACPTTVGGTNTCVGAGAGFADAAGYYNTFVGGVAGANTITGNANTCVGEGACQSNIAGTANVAVGAAAGSANNNRDNVFVGQAAGQSTTGSDNIFIGYAAGDDAPATQSKTIRIGWYPGFLTDTYIQGIWGSTVPAPSTVVCVNAAGKLGSIHPGCSLSLQGQIKTELDQVIAQQQQQIESLQKQNAEFQQRLTRLESLIAQK